MSYEAKVRKKIRRQNAIERAREKLEEENNPTEETILKQQRDNLRRRGELQEEEAKKKQELLDAMKDVVEEDKHIVDLGALGKLLGENPTLKEEVMTYLSGFAPIVQNRADKYQVTFERKGEGEVQRVMKWFDKNGNEVIPIEFSKELAKVQKKEGNNS